MTWSKEQRREYMRNYMRDYNAKKRANNFEIEEEVNTENETTSVRDFIVFGITVTLVLGGLFGIPLMINYIEGKNSVKEKLENTEEINSNENNM